MKALLNVAVNHLENADLVSMPDGSVRHVYVAKQWWNLSLNMASVNVWLNISALQGGAGVAVKWQYSWDGRNWLNAQTAVIAEKTAVGSYAGQQNVTSEIAPYGRLVVEVRDTGAAAQKWVTVDLRAHYKTDK